MQRSRSSRTSSEIGIGFSKCRFSSTNRVSPGPWARVWSCRGHSPPLSHTGQSSGWLINRNSSTPSWAFLTLSESVVTSDFDQAHPAHPHRLHAGVVTESRDECAGPLCRGDQHLALAGSDLTPVEGERDLSLGDVRRNGVGGFSGGGPVIHRDSPPP